MEERINNLLLELAKEINEKILANEFKVVDRTDAKVSIKIDNEDIEIWTYNGDCYAYMVGDTYLPTNVFINPKKCRELLLRNQTEEERQKEINRINREIEKLELLKGKL